MIKKFCPIPSLVLFIAAGLSGIIHIVAINSRPFADFFNTTISPTVRAALAHLTGWLPFSVAESLILCMPLILFALLVGCVKVAKKGGAASCRYILSLASVVSLLYTTFVWGFATGYNNTTLDRRLDLERRDVSANELFTAAKYMLECATELLPEVDFVFGAESVMPYSLGEMNELVGTAYGRVADKYDFVPHLDSRVKFVMLSEPMTYTHISGVYTYFTGEANLNINFPEYSLPFTAAHEMSHQRGIARENEANFMAFLVCISSGDPYVRYSGYINMYEYLANALYSADPEGYRALISTMDNRINGELVAYSEFFDKYRESVASDISGAVNDTYLKLQGQTAGTKSYGLVVDLAVAFVHDVTGE